MNSLLPYQNWKLNNLYRVTYTDPITEKQISYIRAMLKSNKDLALEAFEEVVGVPLERMNKGDGTFVIKCLTGEIQRLSRCGCGAPANMVVRVEYAYSKEFFSDPLSMCTSCAANMVNNSREFQP